MTTDNWRKTTIGVPGKENFHDDFDHRPHHRVPFTVQTQTTSTFSDRQQKVQLSDPIKCTVRYFARFNRVVSIDQRSFTSSLTRTAFFRLFSCVVARKMTSDFHLCADCIKCVKVHFCFSPLVTYASREP